MTVVKALQGLAALMATALVAATLARFGNVGDLLPVPVGVFAGALGYIFLLYSGKPDVEQWDEEPFLVVEPARRSA